MDFGPVWAELSRQGITLDDETRQELVDHMAALYAVNAHTNLTRVSAEDAPIRHVVDSLLILPAIPRGARVLDLGSGPGFPAWPIAWARPDLEVVALDSTVKMQRFLADHLRPNLSQLVQRAEQDVQRQSYDVVTGRAIAPIGIQAEISAAWLKVGGRFVPYRTEAERLEIVEANLGMLGLRLAEIREAELPGAEAQRLFPIYIKERPTPETYPRTWAKIKAKPLGVVRR